MLVQASLCQTCSETTLLVFPRGGSNYTPCVSVTEFYFRSAQHILDWVVTTEYHDSPRFYMGLRETPIIFQLVYTAYVCKSLLLYATSSPFPLGGDSMWPPFVIYMQEIGTHKNDNDTLKGSISGTIYVLS